MSEKIYCEHCNELVEFNTKENQKIYDKVLHVEYMGTLCYCNQCSQEVHSNRMDSQNNKLAHEEYEKNIISINDIKNLLKKYKIESNTLSNILGWKEDTLTRYINGAKPSIKNSDILKRLYEDSDEMFKLMKKLI